MGNREPVKTQDQVCQPMRFMGNVFKTYCLSGLVGVSPSFLPFLCLGPSSLLEVLPGREGGKLSDYPATCDVPFFIFQSYRVPWRKKRKKKEQL